MPWTKKKTSRKKRKKKSKKIKKEVHDELTDILDQFSKYGPASLEEKSARKIQSLTRGRKSRKDFLKKKESATKIQSRLRGNMTRRKEDIPWTEPLLSVPYRDTDWKNTEGLEIPWEAEKKILKSIIYPEGIDDITEGIDELEKKHYKTTQQLERLKKNPEDSEQKDRMEATLTKHLYDTGKTLYELEKQLQGAKQLNLFQCRAISKLVKADGRLALDPEIKELIRPCRELDIDVYINTVYTLPKGLFRPEQSHSIYSKIKSFPDEIFTNYGKSMLRKTLEDLELMYEGIRHDNRDYREQDEYYMRSHPDIHPRNIILGPSPNRRMSVHRMTRFELLANYYRYSDFNRGVDLEHLESDYYTHPNGRKQFPHLRKGRADGRSSLEETLKLFETNIRSRKMVESFPMDDPDVPPGPSRLSRKIRKQIPFPEEYVVGPLVREDYLDLQIKRMKIHFIFALIGMDDKYKYYQFVRNNIAELKKRLPFSIEDMKLWEKYNKLENLNLEEYDKYFQITDLIKKYKYILDNLL